MAGMLGILSAPMSNVRIVTGLSPIVLMTRE